MDELQRTAFENLSREQLLVVHYTNLVFFFLRKMEAMNDTVGHKKKHISQGNMANVDTYLNGPFKVEA